MTSPLDRRRAGVLAHITSLPEGGDFGAVAYHFIDFLQSCGASVWQILPLGIPQQNNSPYQCLSSHAGNLAFINAKCLVDKGWLAAKHQHQPDFLAKSYAHFHKFSSSEDRQNLQQFCAEQEFWLDDFALFYALKQQSPNSWCNWDSALKNRNKAALQKAANRFSSSILQTKYNQFVFFRLWADLQNYAHEKQVLLFGDVPIFTAYDSADVWANQQVFKLDKSGAMSVVTGVPPDYFSATGQKWGNPHYNWDYLAKTDFKWWVERIKTQSLLFDIVRIDHFRGLQSAWEISADAADASSGQWASAPGAELLSTVQKHCPNVSLIAEDLGIITKEVDDLRHAFRMPGMNILQFAFDGDPSNRYLPHNHSKNSVTYTGTHDNNTTLGWFDNLDARQKHLVYEYLNTSQPMPQALVFAAMSSPANLAIIPMQDILSLASPARMNTPGICNGNWQWRFDWQQLSSEAAERFGYLIRLFAR